MFFQQLYKLLFALILISSVSACSWFESDSSNEEKAKPEITGEPTPNVKAGSEYSFTPNVAGMEGDITFTVENLPEWASFDEETGRISGIPTPNQTGEYTNIIITASNGKESVSLTIESITVPLFPIIAASFSKEEIIIGETATLSWVVTNADVISIDNNIGVVDAEGSRDVSPNITTEYIISASGVGGELTQNLTLTVLPLPALPGLTGNNSTIARIGTNYSFTPTPVKLDGNLTFSIENKPDWLSFDDKTGRLFGVATEANLGSYSGVIISTSSGGLVYKLALRAITVPPIPTISFSLSRLTIFEKESTILNWIAENATSVSISEEIGVVALDGSLDLSPMIDTTYTITVTGLGGVVEKTFSVTVLPELDVSIKANITSGAAPLTVNFTPVLETQNATNRHYWDFEGDGGTVDGGLGIEEANGFDQVISLLTNRLREYDVIGRDYKYTFTAPGVYNTRLRVWDSNGLQEEESITITVENTPPEVQVTASTDNGEIPLTVDFQATANDNEGISTFDWDFDSDGTYDNSTANGIAQHVYTAVGSFQATLRVTDLLGAETVIALPHIEIRANPEGTPSVSMVASPKTGKAPLTVNFSGDAIVPSASPITKWEWDFDGDGTYDDDTGAVVAHQYLSGGNFYARLKITTEDGKTAETVTEISPIAEHLLTITNNTIDTDAGEALVPATINLTIGGDGPRTLVIENRNREIVHTLVAWSDEVTGSYQYDWDGKDDSENILPPGDYYAVLKYKIAGEEKVLDLRATTGGEIFYPSTWGCRRGISPCGTLTVPSYSLEPFAGQPWVFTYSSPYVSEMTSYMTVYTTNQVVNLFFQNWPMGAGNHEIVWNGEGTDSRILPTVNTKYLISLFGHTMAHNVIFLDHGAKLKNLSLTPSILFPNTKSGDNKGNGILIFDLSKTSDIELSVTDVDTGGEVLRKTISNVEGGTGVELTWDGKNNQGVLLAPGPYRVSIQAKDNSGYKSLPIHAMQRIQY